MVPLFLFSPACGPVTSGSDGAVIDLPNGPDPDKSATSGHSFFSDVDLYINGSPNEQVLSLAREASLASGEVDLSPFQLASPNPDERIGSLFLRYSGADFQTENEIQMSGQLTLPPAVRVLGVLRLRDELNNSDPIFAGIFDSLISDPLALQRTESGASLARSTGPNGTEETNDVVSISNNTVLFTFNISSERVDDIRVIVATDLSQISTPGEVRLLISAGSLVKKVVVGKEEISGSEIQFPWIVES